MDLKAFAKKHGLKLEVERTHDGDYVASFVGSGISDGYIYCGILGSGANKDAALSDLADGMNKHWHDGYKTFVADFTGNMRRFPFKPTMTYAAKKPLDKRCRF